MKYLLKRMKLPVDWRAGFLEESLCPQMKLPVLLGHLAQDTNSARRAVLDCPNGSTKHMTGPDLLLKIAAATTKGWQVLPGTDAGGAIAPSLGRRQRQEMLSGWQDNAEWPSRGRPLTKVGPSDGCKGDAVPLGGGSVVRFPRIWMSTWECRMIHHDNSLSFLRSMPEGSVDCVITDPPYSGAGFKGKTTKYWDAFAIYYKEMVRVCTAEKRLAISQPPARLAFFDTVLPPSSVLAIDDGVADHRGLSAYFLLMNPKTGDPQSAENWPDDIVPKSIHPFDRDINKMAVVVKAMSSKGDTVLDPFCGSGAIGVACVLLGRKYIGIELLEDRAEDARKRLAAAQVRYLETCPETA